MKSISVKHYTLISYTLLIKLKSKKKPQQHLTTCLHSCIWPAKFNYGTFLLLLFCIIKVSRWLKKKVRNTFKFYLLLHNIKTTTNPQNGYWFQTKRRPSKWFKYWIKCKNNLLKDYANWTQERHERLCIHKRLCAYLPVKFLNPNKKLSRLTLRVFNFIRGGVQL